jgi:hypothetical protein
MSLLGFACKMFKAVDGCLTKTTATTAADKTGQPGAAKAPKTQRSHATKGAPPRQRPSRV